jgi:diacylglycerol kinase
VGKKRDVMKKKGRSLIKSFKNALNGIVFVFRTQRNFKIQLACLLIVLIVAFVFELTLFEIAIIVFAGGMVLVGEMMNTGIEKLVDLINPEYHPLARKAKDVSAGVVLVSSLLAAMLGLLIFIPRIIEFFK